MKFKIFFYPIILFIRIYQFFLSPIIGQNCRYLPTCSEYSIEALKEYGLLKGLFLSIKRIVSCHPFGNSGFDPINKSNKNNTL